MKGDEPPQADGSDTTVETSTDDGVADTGIASTGIADTGVADTGVADATLGDDAGTTAGGATSTTDGGEETSGTTGVAEQCEAPTRLMPCDAGTDDPFVAIGFGCPGGPDQSIPITSSTFASADPNAWIVAPQLGSAVDPVTGAPVWGPHEGDALLVLSTGGVSMSDDLDYAALAGSSTNANPDTKPLPPPMSALPGSNGGVGGTPFVDCDGINDCSETILGMTGDLASDLLWFQVETEVPTGTHGFTLDFAFFSEEWPENVGTMYNDTLVVWSNSESYTGNLCIVDDAPCTVTNLWPSQYGQNSPELTQTGFDDSGGLAWHRIQGSATPGESLQLTVALFDMGDAVRDTLVLLDRFAWDCEGCDPAAGDCIGATPIAP